MTEPSKPKTLVVATSKTGNTMIVAHAVADAYTAGVLYTPETAPADLSHYDTVLLGFWCDKGDAPADMASFADKLTEELSASPWDWFNFFDFWHQGTGRKEH